MLHHLHYMGPLPHCHGKSGMVAVYNGISKRQSKVVFGEEDAKDVVQILRELYKQQGVRGFFAGSGPTILSIVPYMGLNFAFHDVFGRLSQDPSFEMGNGSSGSRGSVLSGVAGMGAGVIGRFLIYPLDTFKKQ